MAVHRNSLLAYADLDLSARRREVLSVFLAAGQPLTDRDCMGSLGYDDPNMVRPRITELVQMAVLTEVGSVRCAETGKINRLCLPVPR